MNELNELQNIWKSAQADKKEMPLQPVPGGLIEKLKKLESKQDRINKVKLLFAGIVIIDLIYILERFNINSVKAYIGVGFVFFGIVYFMIYYLKRQFNIKKLDFTKSSIEFATNAIEMLERQNSVFKKPFLVFVIYLFIGANILCEGLNLPAGELLKMHVIYSLIVLVSAFLGYRVRMWRINREVMPLILELEKLKENLLSENK